MECRLKNNQRVCTCTYEPCERKGKCCECIVYHRQCGELPGCLFPPEVEATYDRSVVAFVRACGRRER